MLSTLKTNSEHGLTAHSLILKYHGGDAFEAKASGQVSFPVLPKSGLASTADAEGMVTG